MYLNQFSLRIVGGNEQSGGYVDIAHGQKYSLQMRNDREERCDARVEIDGQHVGTWRIDRRRTINIDRPAQDDGQFTFYELGSVEGNKSQLNDTSPDLGLVKVTFTPEVKVRPVYQEPNYSFGISKGAPVTMRHATFDTDNTATMFTSSVSGPTRSAGGTGLSGQSQQRFTDASQINYDYSQQTVIQLRLVCAKTDEPRPLTSHATPYPPRIS